MQLSISRDQLLNPVPPRLFLCNTSRKIIGQLPATSVTLNAKWRQYSELSFEIHRTYVDVITGETKVHPLYDKVEAPRNVLLEGYGLFCLQDIDDTSGDKDTKHVTAFSLEYSASNKYLTNFHINTGEIDSKEVLYNETEYGVDYNTDRDSFYKFAAGEFDPYEKYYQRNYTNTTSYTYEQIQISDATEYAKLLEKSNATYGQLADKLYVKKFANVQFYNRNKPGLSLLHLIFDSIPEWNIGNIDQSLWHKERQFSEDRTSVYDFLMNTVSETFGCTFVWDSLNGLVHCYEEVEDDDMQNEASTRFETDVYISKDNLATECQVKYSSDNIKTKLVVTGADDLDIREVNLGRNEIMDLSFYHTEEWMEQDLFERYADYIEEIKEAQSGVDADEITSTKYPVSYNDAVQGRVAANNQYNELMNAIPSENNVLLIGDEFKKLFCVYSPIDSAYARNTLITGSTVAELYYDAQCTLRINGVANNTTFIVQGYRVTYNGSNFVVGDDMTLNAKTALIKKLNQYHVCDDVKAEKSDNILLKLKNTMSDTVTIRIYDPKVAVSSGSVVEEHLNYYVRGNNDTYTKVKVESSDEFESGNIYTNNYTIQSVIFRASSGVTGDAKTYTLDQWLKGQLTAEMNGGRGMDLEGYTVSYIGTMGAYFVLAKDEVVVDDNGAMQISTNYLNSCGINMLKKKHDTYTTVFQTQTEAMFSQEIYQCIIQDEPPEGTYRVGTRWLDSDARVDQPMLYAYRAADAVAGTAAGWYQLTSLLDGNSDTPVNPTDEELYNYENYQRYLDNFNKLKAVQQVLTEKERQAQYCLDGYKVDGISADWNDQSGGDSTEINIKNIIDAHFQQFGDYEVEENLIQETTGVPWTMYTFLTDYDPFTYEKNTKPYNSIEQYYIKHATGESYTAVSISNQADFNTYDGNTNAKTLYVRTGGHTFALYFKDNVPYISYENSQGIYNMIMEYIRNQTDMNTYFTKDQLIGLSPFIKEDEYNDSNFLLTGYESEEERLSIAKDLMESAAKELKSICRPSLEFSMTMANILALPEFDTFVEYFQLGNFIRVEIRDGYVKRTRLLEVNINFDDLSDFSCTFGNLVSVKSEVDRTADLLSQTITSGRSFARAEHTYQNAVETVNQLESDISNGLKNRAIAITSASGQHVTMDHTGLHIRKFKDGSTTEYEPEEMTIINNSLVATNDSWLTAKSAFGKYTIDGEERWGPIAEYVTADRIEGKDIVGGSLKIGGYEGSKGEFIVTNDGEVIIRSRNGDEKYAAKELEDAFAFQVMLVYEGTTVFFDKDKDFCKITCEVYHNGKLITNDVLEQSGSQFVWINSSDPDWEPEYVINEITEQEIRNQIIVKHNDIDRNSQIRCSVDFDETVFNTQDAEGEQEDEEEIEEEIEEGGTPE